jgi:hypothetical protein
MLYALSSMLRNSWMPGWMGGGKRKYIFVNIRTDLEKMEELKRLVEEGKIRVMVDSKWEGGEVLKVSCGL